MRNETGTKRKRTFSPGRGRGGPSWLPALLEKVDLEMRLRNFSPMARIPRPKRKRTIPTVLDREDAQDLLLGHFEEFLGIVKCHHLGPVVNRNCFHAS